MTFPISAKKKPPKAKIDWEPKDAEALKARIRLEEASLHFMDTLATLGIERHPNLVAPDLAVLTDEIAKLVGEIRQEVNRQTAINPPPRSDVPIHEIISTTIEWTKTSP